MKWNLKVLSIYPLPAHLIPFTTEEITSCTNETANGANNAGRNPPSCFFILCFIGSVIQSINTFESSNDSMILIILLIFSFEIKKVNHFPALTAPFFIFFSQIYLLHLKVIDRQLLAQKDVKRCKVLQHFKTYPVHIFKPSRIRIFLPEPLKLFKE